MVKCVDCGFLSYRNLTDRSLVEAESQFRETGEVPQPSYPTRESMSEHTFGTGGGFGLAPICFARAVNLPDEAGISEKEGELITLNNPYVEGILKTIAAGRRCSAFTPWQQGATPKDHREILDRQWMQEYQAEREDADKAFRQRLEDSAQVRHDEQINEVRRGLTKEIVVFGVGVTIILIIAQIAGAFIGRGSWLGSGPQQTITIQQPTQSTPDTADSQSQSVSE